MILAEVVRSGFTECVHEGAVVVLDAAGAVVAEAGDVTGPMFPRSSNKPLQTVGMLRSGLRTADPADLALISGSHYGEPFHVARARRILETAGLTEDALRCPEALPSLESERDLVLREGGGPSRIRMNCSGKHAGMLATCVENDWPLDDYRDAKHPLQAAIAAAVTELVGEPIAATGIDGCGAPVFAFSLTALARGFQRLVAAPPTSFERLVADTMRADPELVAGTGAEDTLLMSGVPGLLAKGGAEGVQVVAIPEVGAVALKISDGAMRARMPVLVSGLRRLGVDEPVLTRLAAVPVLGGGNEVGEVRATW
ncbi:asparaginase [Winogradskya consettensis]|uniref:Asparaginase n=1 Tax=Winogradskya consettensis TaxID=113560 RepID=A0A919VWY3_9ACTN|nr:asparaginase [Actinoplanes consettensis]GIM78040.1 asparaginase [Actinoplanes consettensis]